MGDEDLNWYWRNHEDEFGPMTLSAIRKLAAKGHLLPAYQVRKGDDGKWIAANMVRELYQSLESSQESRGDTEKLKLPDFRTLTKTVIDHLRDRNKLRLLWGNTGQRYVPGQTYEVMVSPDHIQQMSAQNIREKIISGDIDLNTHARIHGASPESRAAEWRSFRQGLALESFPIATVYWPVAAHVVLGATLYFLLFSFACVALPILFFVPMGYQIPLICAVPFAAPIC